MENLETEDLEDVYNDGFCPHIIDLMDSIRGKADIYDDLVTDDNKIEPYEPIYTWQKISNDLL